MENNGLKLLKEFPNIRTMIRKDVGDLDVGGAYPNGGDMLNISKETTYRELCKINGVTEQAQRRSGLNMTAAITNGVEIAVDLHGLPSFDKMLMAFRESRSKVI